MNSTYTSLGNIAGPAMGGILFDMNIHYPYAFSGVVLIVGLAITFMWREKQLAESFASNQTPYNGKGFCFINLI